MTIKSVGNIVAATVAGAPPAPPKPPTLPVPAIPHYCGVQDPAKYAQLAALFQAKRRQPAFAMQHGFRHSALLATLTNRLPLTVDQCEEYSPDFVPQLQNYQPFVATPLTPEEIATKAAVQRAYNEREQRDRYYRQTRPVAFRSIVEVCAFFGSNSEARQKYIDAHPELLKSI
jgi:hypothetical protein